jgi:hypothetical protein
MSVEITVNASEEDNMTAIHQKTALADVLLVGALLVTANPIATASAGDSSPYLIGHWKLHDVFSDFKALGFAPLATPNTEFVFLNPTNLTLTLEYAFYTTNDTTKAVTFCGCDRDTLSPNGRTRYTMQGELEGGQFSNKLCPTQTDGDLKTIVFTGTDTSGNVVIGDALEAGYQVDVLGLPFASTTEIGLPLRTEADLLAVGLNASTRADIRAIHKACVGFIGH